MKYRDLYFNPGSRLRISTGMGYLIWVRWGWSAQWQFSIRWQLRWVWLRTDRRWYVFIGPVSAARL